jgi:hypothetical protein
MNLNPIATNMTELSFQDGTKVLFSYKTPVAAIVNGTYVRTSKKWSRTTSKHINKWLDGINAEEAEQQFFDTLIHAYKAWA